jgi:hypothetical protein
MTRTKAVGIVLAIWVGGVAGVWLIYEYLNVLQRLLGGGIERPLIAYLATVFLVSVIVALFLAGKR